MLLINTDNHSIGISSNSCTSFCSGNRDHYLSCSSSTSVAQSCESGDPPLLEVIHHLPWQCSTKYKTLGCRAPMAILANTNSTSRKIRTMLFQPTNIGCLSTCQYRPATIYHPLATTILLQEVFPHPESVG